MRSGGPERFTLNHEFDEIWKGGFALNNEFDEV
jgi:hypothetical protein